MSLLPGLPYTFIVLASVSYSTSLTRALSPDTHINGIDPSEVGTVVTAHERHVLAHALRGEHVAEPFARQCIHIELPGVGAFLEVALQHVAGITLLFARGDEVQRAFLQGLAFFLFGHDFVLDGVPFRLRHLLPVHHVAAFMDGEERAQDKVGKTVAVILFRLDFEVELALVHDFHILKDFVALADEHGGGSQAETTGRIIAGRDGYA